MREILFRGKRTDNGEWINSSETYIRDGDGIWLSDVNLNVVTVVPETVGQYTGLCDKNGVKVFKGDIVKIVDFQMGCVVYECGAFGIAVNPYIDWNYLDSEIAEITGFNNSPYFCRNDNFISLWELMWNYNQEENSCDVVQVIGNIHDNPELLETAAKPAAKNIAQSGLAPATENFELMEGGQ